MDFFYDSQIKRYLTQFMRMMSNFSYQNAKGELVQIPVRYGDMTRQVAQVLKKNSENILQSAPFIACYIKKLDFARDRLQDPTYVSKINIRERAWDDREYVADANGNTVPNPNYNQEYLNVQGDNYTVERLMPTPFNLEFSADIWTTNTDQKLQILEQLLSLFAPSIEIQTSNNYIDWTSLSYVELAGVNFSSRTVPQGLEQDIDIATLTFTTPIWLTTPAKVKRLGIITKVITNVLEAPAGLGESIAGFGEEAADNAVAGLKQISISATSLGNYGLLVLDKTARLIEPNSNLVRNGSRTSRASTDDSSSMSGSRSNWLRILDSYPGRFVAGLSQIRLTKPEGGEIVAYISLDPSDETIMHLNFDPETTYANTLLTNNSATRGTIDAIIDPTDFNPRPYLVGGQLDWPYNDTRYLVLEDINTNVTDPTAVPQAWRNQDDTYLVAHANDIVAWSAGRWTVIFNSTEVTDKTWITNSRTGIQYAWTDGNWIKSYEGSYSNLDWRLVL